MPCHTAIDKKIFTISPEDNVEHALKAIKKSKAAGAAVVDENGVLLGIVSMKVILKNLIPVSVAMAGDVQIDVKVTAAPGVAKRYKNILPLPVTEVMERKPCTVSPDSAIWESVGLLSKYGNLLCVVDERQKYIGMITYDSLVSTLQDSEISDG